jgi:hypothetical protein
MYESLWNLAFTTAYVGVVVLSSRVSEAFYKSLRDSPPSGVTAWYYEHTKGAIWIATGGEHAEPVTAWLHAAHRQLSCTTMLGAILKNENSLGPPRGGFAYYIPRRGINQTSERLLNQCFTIYIPHCDQFLVLSEVSLALSIHSASDPLPEPLTIDRRADLPPPLPRTRRTGPYDPIDAQVGEVLGPICDTAMRAAADLVNDWQEVLSDPIPSDIRGLQDDIAEEGRRVRELRKAAHLKGSNRDLLSEVDHYAQSLRTLRRIAFDLRSKVHDYEWPKRERATYESVATPLMLRAARRYTAELVEQLDITGYIFLPVVGQDFGMTSKLFPASATSRSAELETSTVVIEVPAEIRLRLGALPMIARPVSAIMDFKLNEIALVFADMERRRYPSIDKLLPPLSVRDGHTVPAEVERYQRVVIEVAKEIAADLLATAIAGPPFVFAMARFAVGNLQESDPTMSLDTRLPPFRTRLRACLGLLDGLHIDSGFRSAYLPDGALSLPPPVVEVIKSATAGVQRPTASDLDRITADLRAGRVSRAPSGAILTALWSAVAARSGYLHEVAALLSVAGLD